MITAVDTNILLDVLIPDAAHREDSERALAQAVRDGAVVISGPVYAELAARFSDKADLDGFVAETGMRLESFGTEALHSAGRAWRKYLQRRPPGLSCTQCGVRQDVQCRKCGATIQPRQHVVADFLIGGHALAQADQLLTRDRGFYAAYFPELRLG